MNDNEKQKELYLDYSFKLLELIFKLEAKDITEKQLFDEVRKTLRPDIYNVMYHKIVKKDYLGSVYEDLDDSNLTGIVDDTDELKILY